MFRGVDGRFFLVLLVLLTSLVTTGSMSHNEQVAEVTFESISSAHFGAFYVKADRANAPLEEPLVVRVTPMGNTSGIDLTGAAAWLKAHWNIRLVVGPQGIPLYFTDYDLVSRGDPTAVGSSLSTGVAVERGSPRLLPCIIAHEIGHVLGLGHSREPDALMWTHCTPKKPGTATTSPDELHTIGSIRSLVAYTVTGPQVWAHRDG